MTTLLETFEILDDEPEEVYNVKSILETLTKTTNIKIPKNNKIYKNGA